jgi:uncharacterized lipoprotein YajG
MTESAMALSLGKEPSETTEKHALAISVQFFTACAANLTSFDKIPTIVSPLARFSVVSASCPNPQA